MAWSGWGSRLNVTSIVSQGLEQVSRLREDVEKQFDQVVTDVKASGQYLRAPAGAASENGAEKPPLGPAEPSAASGVVSVDDIGVTKPSAFGRDVLANLRLQQQPPHSADGKRRVAGVDAQLFPPRAPAVDESPLFAEEKKAVAEQEELEEKLPVVVVAAAQQEANDGDNAPDSKGEDVVLEEEKQTAEATQETEGDEGERASEDGQDEEVVAEVEVVEDHEGAVDDAAAEGDGEVASKVEEDLEPSPPESMGDSAELGEGAARVEEEADEEDDAIDDAADALGDSNTEAIEASPVESAVAEDSAVVQSLRQELALREAQLLATSSTIAELHNELDKTCQREVAAVERARNLADQVERMRLEMEQQAASQVRPSELQALQYELEEKDGQLKALLEEGNALSVKQSQYEQRLRVLRKEKDEEEERKLKFQTQSEALSVQVQDLTTKLKAAEEESKKLTKEVQSLQSNTQATSKKLAKAEQEAAASGSELESARAQLKALTDENQTMKSQIEALKGTSQSHEALTVEKQEMQRTIDFLQNSLHELEQESSRREEMARVELQNMKKKWLDAVGRVDMMGQSVSDATQPLIQQINALREDLRARQDGWKATESALLARIDDATELRRAIEKEKLEAEHEVHALRRKLDSAESELQRKQADLDREKEKVERVLTESRDLRSQVDSAQMELDELKVKLDDETHAKQQLMARINADRLKKLERSESTGSSDTVSSELAEARQRESQLRQELEQAHSELAEMKTLVENAGGTAPRSHRGLSTSSRDSSSHDHAEPEGSRSRTGSGNLVSQASILKSTLETPIDNASLLGVNTTVLGLSQLQQRLRLAEGEKRMLKQQLVALEAKQKQNTDEIVRLSTRNALLEIKETELRHTQQELSQIKQRQQVLLELFGEKEEQVEELQAEVGELKAFYRKQLDTLAGQQR